MGAAASLEEACPEAAVGARTSGVCNADGGSAGLVCMLSVLAVVTVIWMMRWGPGRWQPPRAEAWWPSMAPRWCARGACRPVPTAGATQRAHRPPFFKRWQVPRVRRHARSTGSVWRHALSTSGLCMGTPPCWRTGPRDDVEQQLAHGRWIPRGLCRAEASLAMASELRMAIAATTPDIRSDVSVGANLRRLPHRLALHDCSELALVEPPPLEDIAQ